MIFTMTLRRIRIGHCSAQTKPMMTTLARVWWISGERFRWAFLRNMRVEGEVPLLWELGPPISGVAWAKSNGRNPRNRDSTFLLDFLFFGVIYHPPSFNLIHFLGGLRKTLQQVGKWRSWAQDGEGTTSLVSNLRGSNGDGDALHALQGHVGSCSSLDLVAN